MNSEFCFKLAKVRKVAKISNVKDRIQYIAEDIVSNFILEPDNCEDETES